MSELTDEIVNKGIAEFMGGFLDKHDEDYVLTVMPYTESLDALVPVWEKLEAYKLDFEYEAYDKIGWFLDLTSREKYFKDTREDPLHLSIQQAAAYATYKAIKELKNE
jgi:hypothetical protein